MSIKSTSYLLIGCDDFDCTEVWIGGVGQDLDSLFLDAAPAGWHVWPDQRCPDHKETSGLTTSAAIEHEDNHVDAPVAGCAWCAETGDTAPADDVMTGDWPAPVGTATHDLGADAEADLHLFAAFTPTAIALARTFYGIAHQLEPGDVEWGDEGLLEIARMCDDLVRDVVRQDDTETTRTTLDGPAEAPAPEPVNDECASCDGTRVHCAADGPCCGFCSHSAGPAEAADPGREPIADLIERSSLGTPEAKAARARVSDETAAEILARAMRDSATTTPADDPADEPCRADEGMTGIRCMLDEGHPLPHRGWWRDKNDSTGEYAVYIEWPVPERVSGIRVVPKSGPVSTTPDPAAQAVTTASSAVVRAALQWATSGYHATDSAIARLRAAVRDYRAALAGNTEETP